MSSEPLSESTDGDSKRNTHRRWNSKHDMALYIRLTERGYGNEYQSYVAGAVAVAVAVAIAGAVAVAGAGAGAGAGGGAIVGAVVAVAVTGASAGASAFSAGAAITCREYALPSRP